MFKSTDPSERLRSSRSVVLRQLTEIFNVICFQSTRKHTQRVWKRYVQVFGAVVRSTQCRLWKPTLLRSLYIRSLIVRDSKFDQENFSFETLTDDFLLVALLHGQNLLPENTIYNCVAAMNIRVKFVLAYLSLVT